MVLLRSSIILLATVGIAVGNHMGQEEDGVSSQELGVPTPPQLLAP
jgi:hypothetical protein